MSTYYVKNGGSDAASGLSDALAWETIAKVNGSSFSPGDSILFKKGSTWREQLTVPSSGSDGLPITFGAYGSGAHPILDGSNLITPGTSWAANSGSVTGNVTQANMRLSIIDGTAFADFNSAGALIPYLGNKLTVTDSGGKKLIGYIKAAGSAETYGSELLPNTGFADTTNVTPYHGTLASVGGGQSGNCLQVTIDTGQSDGAGIEAASTTSGWLLRHSVYFQEGTASSYGALFIQDGSDYTTLIINAPWQSTWAQWIQYVTAKSAGVNTVYQGLGSQTQTVFYDTATLKQVLTPSSTGVTITSTANGTTYNWTSEESGFNRNDSVGYTYSIDTSLPNVWQATVTTEPKIVFFDGTKGAGVASAVACVSARDWYWSGNVLYIYSTTDPDTAYTSPGIEVGARDQDVWNTSNYITFQGLSFIRSNHPDLGNIYQGGTHAIFDDCELSWSAGSGIVTTGSSASVVVKNSSLHDNVKSGLYTYHDASASGTESYVQSCTVYNNLTWGVYVRSSYWIIERNEVYGNGSIGVSNGVGINFCDLSNEGYAQHCVARYNHVHHTYDGGDNGEGILADIYSAYIEIYNNVLHDNSGPGTGVWAANHVKIYNNTLYANAQDYYTTLNTHTEIKIGGSSPGDTSYVEIKNNVVQATIANTHAVSVDATAYGMTGLSITNNDWYAAATNWYFWNATGGNVLATWNALTGVGTDLNSDPLFTNAAGGDFTLAAASPCIDAGVDLGTTYQMALAPGSTWP